ncbi:hypothetical protein [uncultured Bilophila sp.]|nr:hypothetical protein [uncultured Bilophila sp.]
MQEKREKRLLHLKNGQKKDAYPQEETAEKHSAAMPENGIRV